jgi:hypothetical protein
MKAFELYSTVKFKIFFFKLIFYFGRYSEVQCSVSHAVFWFDSKPHFHPELVFTSVVEPPRF